MNDFLRHVMEGVATNIVLASTLFTIGPLLALFNKERPRKDAIRDLKLYIDLLNLPAGAVGRVPAGGLDQAADELSHTGELNRLINDLIARIAPPRGRRPHSGIAPCRSPFPCLARL